MEVGWRGLAAAGELVLPRVKGWCGTDPYWLLLDAKAPQQQVQLPALVPSTVPGREELHRPLLSTVWFLMTQMWQSALPFAVNSVSFQLVVLPRRGNAILVLWELCTLPQCFSRSTFKSYLIWG